MSNITKTHVSDGLNSRYVYRNSDGQFHRLDGPAIEYDNGNCSWFNNGLAHREDGPAKEWPAFNVFYWCLYDEILPFKNWCSKLNKSPEEINSLKSKYSV